MKNTHYPYSCFDRGISGFLNWVDKGALIALAQHSMGIQIKLWL